VDRRWSGQQSGLTVVDGAEAGGGAEQERGWGRAEEDVAIWVGASQRKMRHAAGAPRGGQHDSEKICNKFVLFFMLCLRQLYSSPIKIKSGFGKVSQYGNTSLSPSPWHHANNPRERAPFDFLFFVSGWARGQALKQDV
jgi:hypothetical protein